jgi:serine/threonine-protein kinase
VPHIVLAEPALGSLGAKIGTGGGTAANGRCMQRRPSTVRGGPGGAGPDGVVLPPGFVLSGAAPQPPATLTAVTVAATRVVDGLPVWVHTVTAEVDAGTSRRLRTQFPELADLLARLAPTAPLAAPVTVSAAGEARPFLVTFRTGPRLAPAAPIPVPLARRIVHDAARALAALHAAGLVHGGVVPGAFFRDGDGVRLDPPLPSALADAVAAGVAAVGGTGHEPPEVLQGGAPGPAADVYALASSVWTLLAGHPPHRGDPDAARLARLRDAPVPRLARGDVGVAAESALRAALAADPARRPDLDALAQAFAVAEPTASGAGRLDTLPARPPQRPGPSGGGQPLGSRYLLDELVGRGATGHVWRAHIRDSGQTVAVKLLRSELAEDPDVVTRFMRERTTLTAVDHPHVVRVRDLVAEGGALAVIMDYVDGTDICASCRPAGRCR